MQNIKYHVISLSSMILFSYISAVTINGVIKNTLVVYPSEKSRVRAAKNVSIEDQSIDINQLVESGFFRAAASGSVDESEDLTSPVSDFKLIGTVTGPPGIARALVLKKGEREPDIFKLRNNMYGYIITDIQSSKILLKKKSEVHTLNLYEKKDFAAAARPAGSDTAASGGVVKKNISRAEMQQKVMNDIDNAMQGIQAGPHRVNGQIEGFKLIRIRPYNILYEYGIRSGDIIKRINGKKVDSTEKLFNMWQGIKNESKMVIDVERNGQIMTFEMNITD